MNNIEKILEYIKSQTITECEEISKAAEDECERIRTEFARKEQDEYWKSIDIGTKETEKRLENLKELAAAEAKKQIDSLHNEMLDEAFTLAARVLSELPHDDYDKLLKRLGFEADCSPDIVVEQYRTEMGLAVMSALFE